FSESFESLMTTIEARRDGAMRGLAERITLHIGNQNIDDAVKKLEKDKAVERIWKKDAALWKDDDAHKKIIGNALGWLNVSELMLKNAKDLVSFAESVRKDFDDVVVLGMG